MAAAAVMAVAMAVAAMAVATVAVVLAAVVTAAEVSAAEVSAAEVSAAGVSAVVETAVEAVAAVATGVSAGGPRRHRRRRRRHRGAADEEARQEARDAQTRREEDPAQGVTRSGDGRSISRGAQRRADDDVDAVRRRRVYTAYTAYTARRGDRSGAGDFQLLSVTRHQSQAALPGRVGQRTLRRQCLGLQAAFVITSIGFHLPGPQSTIRRPRVAQPSWIETCGAASSESKRPVAVVERSVR